MGITRSQFEYKCQRYGGLYWEVAPKGSSQRCHVCGHEEKANRPTQALFQCQACGYTDNADFQAAATLRQRGITEVLALGLLLFKDGQDVRPADGLAAAARRRTSRGKSGEARIRKAKGPSSKAEILALPA